LFHFAGNLIALSIRVFSQKYLRINLFLPKIFLKYIPCHPTITDILAFDPPGKFSAGALDHVDSY